MTPTDNSCNSDLQDFALQLGNILMGRMYEESLVASLGTKVEEPLPLLQKKRSNL